MPVGGLNNGKKTICFVKGLSNKIPAKIKPKLYENEQDSVAY